LIVKPFKKAFMGKCSLLKNLSFKKKALPKEHYTLYTITNEAKNLYRGSVYVKGEA